MQNMASILQAQEVWTVFTCLSSWISVQLRKLLPNNGQLHRELHAMVRWQPAALPV